MSERKATKRNLIDQNYIQRASKTVFKDARWQHQSTCTSCTILWGLGEGGRGKANKQVRGSTSPPYPTQNHTKKYQNLEANIKQLQLSLFCFTSLCNWSRRLAPLSQQIIRKTTTNHDLVARVLSRVLSRFRQFA